MKRLFLALTVFCLLLCSCSPDGSVGGKGFLYESEPTATSYGGWRKHSKLEIYREQVFYEVDAKEGKEYQAKVYCTSVAQEQTPALLFDGAMIGLFGSVLVCRDDSAYYAMDLERGKKWVELSAVGEHTAFAADSTVLYLYGKTEEGAYCDTLSLAELKVQRAAEQYPVWDAAVIDGVLYRILETPQGLQLYRGNALFSEQAGACMEEESGVLFFRGATPRYVGAVNLSNGEYRTIDSLFVTFGNGIYGQGSSEQNAKYFDIATGKEIIPTEEQLNRRPLENGHYIYEKTVCCITLDGKEYRVDLSGYGSATPKVSEYGVAFRYDASLVTVDWEGQILRHYLDYEL